MLKLALVTFVKGNLRFQAESFGLRRRWKSTQANADSQVQHCIEIGWYGIYSDRFGLCL